MTNTATAPRIMVGAAASLLVFSLLSVIGVFSPWLSFGPISKPGIEADGAIVLITLVTPVIAGIIGLATKNISRGLGAGVFGSALLGVIICVYDLAAAGVAPRAAAPAAGVEPFKRALDILKLRRSNGLPEPEFLRQVVVEAVMSDGPMALQVQKLKSLQDQNFLSAEEFEQRLSAMIWHEW